MMRPVYYNDHDKFCCAWLRELIADGHLPAGDVDDRSIKDVQPDDLRGYLQIHLFAGIGGWPYALRLAGFPDDRECWTASCPCPPFSSAGKSKACPECDGTNPVPCPRRTGFFICCLCGHAWLADDRHLWPEVWRLVRDRRPQLVVGEQVASPDGRTWLASVRASLEILSYAPWGADLPAAGVGLPHARQRLFWMADTELCGSAARGPSRTHGRPTVEPHRCGATGELAIPPGEPGRLPEGCADRREDPEAGGRGEARRVEHAAGIGRDGSAVLGEAAGPPPIGAEADERRRAGVWKPERSGAAGGVGDASRKRSRRSAGAIPGSEGEGEGEGGRAGRLTDQPIDASSLGDASRAGFPPRERDELLGSGRRQEGRAAEQSGGSFWADVEWLYCRDGKWRPTEPGIFPLSDGIQGRVALLRGAGNSIVPQVAAHFIEVILASHPQVPR